MKSFLKFFLAISLLFALIPASLVHAENTVNVYFFYDQACIHCADENEFLSTLEDKYAYLVVQRFEVTTSPDNNALFEEMKTTFSNEGSLTPYTVIGGVALIGFNDQTKLDIERLIVRYSTTDFVDIFAKVQAGQEVLPTDYDDLNFESGQTINLPIIGEVQIDSLSLFVAAVVIGFVDGFNPCAMWVLIFLITLLMKEKNRKKMWLLGSVFLFASALMYFLVMVAWLQVAVQMTTILWIRYAIGVIAIGFGGYQLRKLWKDSKKQEVGCDTTDQVQKIKIMDRIKKVVLQKNLWLALIGIVALAVSVNFVELACSAGLPLLFTQILAFNELGPIEYYFYIFIYILFFLIDDLVVFIIAMVTLNVTGISNKYGKVSSLVGGVIMLLIGILLIFFPSIIMFRF